MLLYLDYSGNKTGDPPCSIGFRRNLLLFFRNVGDVEEPTEEDEVGGVHQQRELYVLENKKKRNCEYS